MDIDTFVAMLRLAAPSTTLQLNGNGSLYCLRCSAVDHDRLVATLQAIGIGALFKMSAYITGSLGFCSDSALGETLALLGR